MRVTLCLLVLLAAVHADSLWFKTAGGPGADESWAVATDSLGNVFWVTHQTVPHFWASLVLYKLRPDGSEIWHRVWNDTNSVLAYVAAVREPYVYVGGAFWQGTADMFVTCFDASDGHEVWRYVWGQGYGYEEVDGLVVDSSGVYVAGWTTPANSKLDLAVLKLNHQGQQQWLTTYGTPNWDEQNGQMYVDDSVVYVAGRYDGPSQLTGGDALLLALRKSTGDTLWHRTWHRRAYNDAYGMTGDTSGLYVVGITMDLGQEPDIFVLRYNLSGNLVWDTLWGGPGSDISRTLVVGPDNFLYVGGKTTSYGAGAADVVLLRMRKDGGLEWCRTWGGDTTDEAHGMCAIGDNIYIAGETYTWSAGQNDALLIKATRFGDFPSGVLESGQRPATAGDELRVSSPAGNRIRVGFSLKRDAAVRVSLLDLAGRDAVAPVTGRFRAGGHAVFLDAGAVATGIYLCRVETDRTVMAAKVVRFD
ncbi:MAG: PQQ-binding-like beta-propeller repeat protein [candidate division WOR-3 bacterium]|nr:PQQ-binding-like beta-propeller repeat protein [candidate division WOR-3 bacterium]